MPVNAASGGLDWQAFSAAYFPDRRRHDLEALTAYGTYRRSRKVDADLEENGAGAGALEAWEDEGGPVL